MNTTKYRTSFPTALAVVTVTSLFVIGMTAPASRAEIPAILGSGNFNDARVDAVNSAQYAALAAAGCRACRIPVYPYTYYWAQNKPTPERLDAGMLQAHASGITPMILFEYYTRNKTPLGDYGVWREIGKAFADRFKPNSAWWLSEGIKDYGISLYSAMNEPDIDNPVLAPAQYHDAIKGLADGIHASDPALKAIPGGIAGPNSRGDFKSAGLGPAIADLLNDGTLDGIDIHTYNGQWAPLADNRHSAQHDFDAVKKAWGVTRDVNFYCTEFNYQENTGEVVKGNIGDSAAASYFLTMIWDHLGVAGNSGESVTKLALVWNLFNTAANDPAYGLCASLSPWTPNSRGKVYQMVANLTNGTSMSQTDPLRSGSISLTGSGKTIWVWQDRPNYTAFPGTTCLLTGIPRNATAIRVYGWDGLRETISVKGARSVRIDNLRGYETYMFVVDAISTGSDKPAIAP